MSNTKQITLAFFFIFVLLAATYIAPNNREIALMQMKDFQYRTAMDEYSNLYSHGDVSIDVIAPLIRLKTYYGDMDGAINILENYAALQPGSIEAWKKLAELYKSSQRLTDYCFALEQLEKRSPSRKILRQLADTYYFLGNKTNEQNALSRLIASEGYQFQERDYLRLAYFYRLKNEKDEAITVLTDGIKSQNFLVNVDLILFATQLYLEDHEEEKAVRLAKKFLRQRFKEEDALAISAMLDKAGYHDGAYDIISPYTNIPDLSVNFRLQIFNVMVAQKKGDEVYGILIDEYQKYKNFSVPLLLILSDLAVARADIAIIEKLIANADLGQFPEYNLLRLAEATFRENRPELAQAMLAKLDFNGPSALQAVLKAIASNSPSPLLEISTPPNKLSVQARLAEASIFIKHRMMVQGVELLDSVPLTDVSMAFDAIQYADLYLAVNAPAKVEERLKRDVKADPGFSDDYRHQTLVLLAAGQGKTLYVLEQLSNYPVKDRGLGVWADSMELAKRYHQDDTSLAIAKNLFELVPTNENRATYAELLMSTSNYAEALDLLEGSWENNPDIRALYLDVAATMFSQNSAALRLSSERRVPLNKAIEAALNTPSSTPDQKKEYAYLYAALGSYHEAETILLRFAANQPFTAPDVQSLLGFLAEHPSHSGTAWVMKRAMRLDSPDNASWLQYLNDGGQAPLVKAILENKNRLSSEQVTQYIDALITLNEKDNLRRFLDSQIEKENATSRIKQLILYSRQEDFSDLTQKGLERIHNLDPSDFETTKDIGLSIYYTRDYMQAEPYLKQYFDNPRTHVTKDYKALMAYGDIVRQLKGADEAQAYYVKAYDILVNLEFKEFDMQRDEARLMFLTNHKSDAINYYHRLLAKYPNNKDIRADFAEQLIQAGHFDEAGKILGD